MKILAYGAASAVCAICSVENLFGIGLWFLLASLFLGFFSVSKGIAQLFKF